MSEVELERLIVRIVGDGSDYKKVLDQSVEHTHRAGAHMAGGMRGAMHSVHLLSAVSGLEGISRPAIMAYYAYHMLHGQVDKVREKMSTLGGASQIMGGGGVLAGVLLVARAYAEFHEEQTKAGKAAVSTFTKMIDGSVSLKDSLKQVKFDVMKEGFEEAARKFAAPTLMDDLKSAAKAVLVTSNPLVMLAEKLGISWKGVKDTIKEAFGIKDVDEFKAGVQEAMENAVKAQRALEELRRTGGVAFYNLQRESDQIKTEKVTEGLLKEAFALEHVGRGAKENEAIASRMAATGETEAQAIAALWGELERLHEAEQLVEGLKFSAELDKMAQKGYAAGIALEKGSVAAELWQKKQDLAAKGVTMSDADEGRFVKAKEIEGVNELKTKIRDLNQEMLRVGLGEVWEKRAKAMDDYKNKFGKEMPEKQQMEMQEVLTRTYYANVNKRIAAAQSEAMTAGLGKTAAMEAKMLMDAQRETGEQNIEVVRQQTQAARDLAAEQEKLKSMANIEGTVRNLEWEAETLGMTAEQAKRFGEVQKYAFDTMREGETWAQAEARAIQEINGQMERMATAQDKIAGQKLFDETRTPMEKYAKQVAELNRLKATGAINEDTYGRAVNKAGKEILKNTDAIQKFDAAKAGSAEAISRIQAQHDKYNESLADTAQMARLGVGAATYNVTATPLGQAAGAGTSSANTAVQLQKDQVKATQEVRDAIVKQGRQSSVKLMPANIGGGGG